MYYTLIFNTGIKTPVMLMTAVFVTAVYLTKNVLKWIFSRFCQLPKENTCNLSYFLMRQNFCYRRVVISFLVTEIWGLSEILAEFQQKSVLQQNFPKNPNYVRNNVNQHYSTNLLENISSNFLMNQLITWASGRDESLCSTSKFHNDAKMTHLSAHLAGPEIEPVV